MTYQEAVSKIDSRLLFGMNPGLERITALLKELDNPQDKLKYVHICGTNGKGTVCTLTASILQKAGYKTGKNISPYVLNFRERFQIDGKMISEEELAKEVEVIWPAVERLDARGIPVSEFELVTAIAFHWFAKEKCDIAVMEVGMGGRYDATNVIKTPEVATIMSISLDHTAWLGNTVEQIAQEKAGIIKEGGCVVLYPEQEPSVHAIIQDTCQKCGAELHMPDLTHIQVLRTDISGTDMEIGGLKLHMPFLGEHQIKNAAVALEMIDILRQKGFAISENALDKGFSQAFIPARMEIIAQQPLCLLDGGHNPGCAKVLRDALKRFVPGHRIAIIGMLADKDSTAALSLIGPMFQKIIAVTPDSPRALAAEELAKIASRFCPNVLQAKSCAQAVDMAFDGLERSEALIVCGSFYLASEIRDMLYRQFR
ncbi:bifunctional folylpolyglutamate synthase/dihydrofolate synthase [Acutalibacter caecimuris]|uniref:bifunctional folylpolyglutamate synthase/dihydrofolate synthase n=1 Tax=Acutalibacter caecimuris TaxID=3093657 RepID=UPI002AC98527|nr:folylpolyglutamate synthase/dihydrofolate synthase family protein [Acutalibacter sp. M00118]